MYYGLCGALHNDCESAYVWESRYVTFGAINSVPAFLAASVSIFPNLFCTVTDSLLRNQLCAGILIWYVCSIRTGSGLKIVDLVRAYLEAPSVKHVSRDFPKIRKNVPSNNERYMKTIRESLHFSSMSLAIYCNWSRFSKLLKEESAAGPAFVLFGHTRPYA